MLAIPGVGCRHVARDGRPPLFVLADPRGDDHGDGELLFPRGPDLEPGDLDLLSLTARADGEGTLFQATFARPIRPPPTRPVDGVGTQLSDVARLGFFAFNLDVYVDLDGVPGSGEVALLPGRKAEVAPEGAWERCIALVPRPAEARGLLRAIWLEQARRLRGDGRSLGRADQVALEAEVDRRLARVHFPTRVQVSGATVSFRVPPEFLGGPASPSAGYLVAVTGARIEVRFDPLALIGAGRLSADEPLMLMEIAPGPPREGFGGGREFDPLQPPIVDLVVPPGASQEALLRGDPTQPKQPRRLPVVVPAGRTP